MDIADFLASTRALGASDLHLSVDASMTRAHARIDGGLVPIDNAPDAAALLDAFLDVTSKARLDREGDAEATRTLGGGRVRLRASRTRSGVSLFLRLLPSRAPTLEELCPVAALRTPLETLTQEENGLILCTGASGSGKTTTAATLIHHLNRQGGRHILTIEDPLEYLHEAIGGPVTQREVGADTPGFAPALDAALRADPDVILVGEVRDAATFSLALRAAETGHLVLTTLHAASAPGAVDRVIDLFSLEHRDRARDALSSTLTAIVHHHLLPRKGGGRILAPSILRGHPAVRAAIRDGRTRDIASLMAAGQAQGMLTEDLGRDLLFEAGLTSEP